MPSIRNIGVIGAGTMGNGIAQACAVAGLTVTMIDINDEAALAQAQRLIAQHGRSWPGQNELFER